MTIASAIILAAVVAAFAFYMAMLAYGLRVAGEPDETASAEAPAAGAVTTAEPTLLVQARGGKARSRRQGQLDKAA